MRGSKVKRIRKSVYGDDFSPRARTYYRNSKTGQIIADQKRRVYQLTKAKVTRESIHQ